MVGWGAKGGLVVNCVGQQAWLVKVEGGGGGRAGTKVRTPSETSLFCFFIFML